MGTGDRSKCLSPTPQGGTHVRTLQSHYIGLLLSRPCLHVCFSADPNRHFAYCNIPSDLHVIPYIHVATNRAASTYPSTHPDPPTDGRAYAQHASNSNSHTDSCSHAHAGSNAGRFARDDAGAH